MLMDHKYKFLLLALQMLDLEDNKDNQYSLAIVSSPRTPSPRSSFKLPDGWIVEEVPRKSGGSADKVLIPFLVTVWILS